MARVRHTKYLNKWVTFAASCLIQACAGLSYSFSIYAPSIKDRLSLSQTEIATVGSAVNLGGYFAMVAGLIYDRLETEHQLGPRLVICLGSLCCFCGYMGLWLLASGNAPGEFWYLLLFATCAGNSGVWFDTSALVTNVRNFPNDRGFVVGILKSFLGLSASVYTSLYIAAFEPDVVRYLLLLALLPPVLCAALSLLVNVVPYVEEHELSTHTNWLSTEGRFLMGFMLVASLAVYQMSSAWFLGHQEVGPTGRSVLAAITMGLLSLTCLLTVRSGGLLSQYAHEYAASDQDAGLRSSSRQSSESRLSSLAGDSPDMGLSDAQPLLRGAHHARAQSGGAGGGGAAATVLPAAPPARPGKKPGRDVAHHDADKPAAAAVPMSPPGELEDLGEGGLEEGATRVALPCCTTSQMLGSFDFWLYFTQFMVGTGLCLSFLNNLGQLVAALGGSKDGHVVLVSLFSVANAAGRLLGGYVPEQRLHASGTPRTLWLAIVAVIMAGSALWMSRAGLGELYTIAIVLGLVFGAHWSLLPSITSDVFGLKHFAANYATLQIAPALGSYLLATLLTGWLYDEAARQHGDPHLCIGRDCFGRAYEALSVLACVSALMCILAVGRSRRLYTAIHQHLHALAAKQHDHV